MSSIGTAIELLSKNRGDIEDVIQKIGGLDTLFKIAPDVFRIVGTITRGAPDPVVAVQTAQATLAYSEQTRERVAAFQKKYGLTEDGIVGDETWTKVESLISP